MQWEIMDRQDTKNIWDAVSSGLKSFILSKVKNEEDASDILQDTYLKIHLHIHKLKDTARIKPWNYQITRNLITDYYRAGNRGNPVRYFKEARKCRISGGQSCFRKR